MNETNGRGANPSGLVVGAILGAAVGAGVALLCAPRSGKETRELLARKSREIRERAARAFVQGRHTARRQAAAMAVEREEEAENL
jgi:gas vesicle protein